MSEIKINDLKDLHPAGAEFFADDEGYLTNLSDDEMDVWGGATNVVFNFDPLITNKVISQFSIVVLFPSRILPSRLTSGNLLG